MRTPRSPHLAPGLRVVRRGLHHLQIGLYDERQVLLPRTAGVERALALLLDRHPTDPDLAVTAVLDQLQRHDCLAWDRGGDRVSPTVAVLGRLETPGLPDPAELLRAAGITLATSPREADAVLVLSAGELDRERLDPLIRHRTSHVVVRLVDGGALIGPFAVPGLSPCLRCIDAHLSVRDPDHVPVTNRYVRASGRARGDGVPDVEPALAAVALAWAVRDVIAHLDGREPSTWARTLFLGANPANHHENEWLRHPQCGCFWAADDRSSGTMEA